MEDLLREEWQWCYFKDSSGREIDFTHLKNQEPFLAIQCKLTQTDVLPVLSYFKQRSPNTRIVKLQPPYEKFDQTSLLVGKMDRDTVVILT
jgi:hypothetical protein